MRAAEGARLLKIGNYRDGFPLFDQFRDDPENTNKAPVLPFPRWRGEPVNGKRILIWSEHGFGDQIMYARFAKRLVDSGASVQWACPRTLARLLATTGVEVLPDDEPFEISGCDYYSPSSALPLGFDLEASTIPAEPYLFVPPTLKVAQVGVMTAGSATNPLRSLPTKEASLLLSLPGAVDLAPTSTGVADFYETGRIIAGLDLVISVDTAVAHLAGALGKRLIVLLPSDADWRWGMEGRTPWYPDATLLRRGLDLSWTSVVAEAVAMAKDHRNLGGWPPSDRR